MASLHPVPARRQSWSSQVVSTAIVDQISRSARGDAATVGDSAVGILNDVQRETTGDESWPLAHRIPKHLQWRREATASEPSANRDGR